MVSLLPDVRAVEGDRPGLAAVGGLLPELADAAVFEFGEGETFESHLAVRPLRLAVEAHRALLVIAREFEDAAGVIHPCLLPLPLRGVIDVEALAAAAAARARPVLEDDAVAENELHAVGAGLLTPRVEHVPLADPEVELPVLGARLAGRRRRRWRRRCRRLRARHFEV